MIFRFTLDGNPVELGVNRMVNAGYAGRDQSIVRQHIDELAAIGVSVPKRVPTFYPVPMMQLTNGNEIQVGCGKTSAEVEYVYLVSGGRRYITVGSDHSDRELEIYSVSKAKQICPNVIAPELWEYETVKDHLDELVLTCEVYKNAAWRLYQNGVLASLLSPEVLIELGRDVLDDPVDNLVLYSGTIPTTGEITYASKWRISLVDRKLNRQISTEYVVKQLPECIE